MKQINRFIQVHCERCLFHLINTENACDMLIMADVHNAGHLKKFLASYIHVNAKAIKESEVGQKLVSLDNILVLKALAGISL